MPLFRFQLREQDHVANAFLAEEHHAQTIDPDADAARRGHAVFERDEEILVHLLPLAAGLMFLRRTGVAPVSNFDFSLNPTAEAGNEIGDRRDACPTSLRLQLREQDHVANALLTERHHAQAVNLGGEPALAFRAIVRDRTALVGSKHLRRGTEINHRWRRHSSQ